ncbi:hypothetical protein A1O1_01694 [Capronia coronata CBS 617.96]|uniref:RecA family profile 1 domain-containing protein n=1 Tax=Capronia coronata CBS 617.96 TaxID=1182541 RepID=W9YK76_9EURO|nr:uncharacterized protein A1O1_01694 [Capronia coronata CBS 617.96]EXJ93302.1 hypothetical protein A1O1_01694 [Capronia coronata CBS 617.96]
MSDLLEVIPDFDIKPYTHLLHSLEKNDIIVADLITSDPKEIARRCPLPSADVQRLVADVIKALQGDVQSGMRKICKAPSSRSGGNTAGATIEHINEGTATVVGSQQVKTLDAAIDQALAGGFQPGQITEIVGESAVGKTQLVLGLLLSVQLPPPRGMGKGAIYVSTEAPLNTSRLKQMLYSHPGYESMEPEDRPSLDYVHTIATNDLEAQEHILRYQLPVAVQRFKIGLVVLDSVAANFRAEHETRTPAGLAERAVELVKLGAMLRRVAIENQVAIVVTNQVSDRFDDPKNVLRSSSPATASSPALAGPNVPPGMATIRQEVQSLDYQQQFFTGWGDDRQGQGTRGQYKNPALGLAWANQISARIVLKMESERQEYVGGNIWRDRKKSRTFAVVFAPWAPPTYPAVPYEIGTQGIVSVPQPVGPPAAPTAVDEEHADLLNEELWATDEDDEFP